MKIIFAVVSVLLLSGCIPKYVPVAPSVKGVVVDAVSGKPLEGVSIENVKTDEFGKFYIEAEQELGVAMVMGGVWPITKRFSLSLNGYYTRTCECDTLTNNAECSDVIIALMPKSISAIETNVTLLKPIGQSKDFSPKIRCSELR